VTDFDGTERLTFRSLSSDDHKAQTSPSPPLKTRADNSVGDFNLTGKLFAVEHPDHCVESGVTDFGRTVKSY
jgi:hypothetical protein